MNPDNAWRNCSDTDCTNYSATESRRGIESYRPVHNHAQCNHVRATTQDNRRPNCTSCIVRPRASQHAMPPPALCNHAHHLVRSNYIHRIERITSNSGVRSDGECAVNRQSCTLAWRTHWDCHEKSIGTIMRQLYVTGVPG